MMDFHEQHLCLPQYNALLRLLSNQNVSRPAAWCLLVNEAELEERRVKKIVGVVLERELL